MSSASRRPALAACSVRTAAGASGGGRCVCAAWVASAHWLPTTGCGTVIRAGSTPCRSGVGEGLDRVGGAVRAQTPN